MLRKNDIYKSIYKKRRKILSKNSNRKGKVYYHEDYVRTERVRFSVISILGKSLILHFEYQRIDLLVLIYLFINICS